MLEAAPTAARYATSSGTAIALGQGRTSGITSRRPIRLVLLLGGGIGLAAGTWTGLSRAGVPLAAGPAGDHGVLMTLGFLGTLIALERAVAHRTRWGYCAPALAGCAVLALVFGAPRAVTGALFTLAGLFVTLIYTQIWRHSRPAHLAIMGLGAVAWVIAACAWMLGASPVRLAPTLAAFIVLTIVGERIELSRLRQPSATANRRLYRAIALFIAGVIGTWFSWRTGLVVGGVGLVATTAWFVRHDIARVTVRKPGLPRFAAVCMLAGYVWLALGGLLWIALAVSGSALLYDAAIHAVFLGFALSMVMGHAPIILPAVLGVALPYRPVSWVPLTLLHLTVTARVVADLAGSTWGREFTAIGNAVALAAFAVASTAIAVHARIRPAVSI